MEQDSTGFPDLHHDSSNLGQFKFSMLKEGGGTCTQRCGSKALYLSESQRICLDLVHRRQDLRVLLLERPVLNETRGCTTLQEFLLQGLVA